MKKGSEEPLKFLVARTRFELVISALRGRRPKPLDERAICNGRMAGMEGVEPPLTEPESAVLPLDDIPLMHPLRSCVAAFAQESILGDVDRRRKYFFEKVCGRGEIMQTAGQRGDRSAAITLSSPHPPPLGWLETGSFQPTEQPVTPRGVPSLQKCIQKVRPRCALGRLRLLPAPPLHIDMKKGSEEPLKFLVARTRFELVISALRGRRPKPLDERAMWCSAFAQREYYGMTGAEARTNFKNLEVVKLLRSAQVRRHGLHAHRGPRRPAPPIRASLRCDREGRGRARP